MNIICMFDSTYLNFIIPSGICLNSRIFVLQFSKNKSVCHKQSKLSLDYLLISPVKMALKNYFLLEDIL